VNLPGPNDGSYAFCLKAPRTFWDAEADCQKRGGHLASIHSEDQQKAIAYGSFASSNGVWSNWWIGLNDVDSEGSFAWTDGTPLDYSNWFGAEPNNAGGVEHCVHIHGHEAGLWNDIPCENVRPYICLLP